MFVGVDSGAGGEEEVGVGGSGEGGLDPADRLGDGAELERPHAGGGQQRREDHVVPGGDAHDVVKLRVQAFEEPAAGPAGAEDHHPGFLAGFGGLQPRLPLVVFVREVVFSGRGRDRGRGGLGVRRVADGPALVSEDTGSSDRRQAASSIEQSVVRLAGGNADMEERFRSVVHASGGSSAS